MSTVLMVVLIVFAGAAVLAVTFGPLVYAMTNLDMDWRAWVGVWLWTLALIGVVAGCITLYVQKHPDQSANACADRGGVWSVVGKHPQLVGKVVTTVTEYGCVMPR